MRASEAIPVETTWKPTVAGIINIVIGVLNMFGMFILMVVLVAIGGGVMALSRIAELMPLWLSGTIQGFMVIAALLMAVFSALLLIGGINALQRKNWGLALAGSIVAILSTTLPGIAATVLVALSRKEFE
ncbi:MAG: hypothetical protein V3R92_01105 [Dehalococcoidales bacterium]